MIDAGAHKKPARATEQEPVQGTPQFTAEYQGATWQFASAAHRDLFTANPAK